MTRSDSTGTPLISAADLAEALRRPNPPAVLDVRWKLNEPNYGQSSYDDGHIPGAVFCDLDTVLSSPPGSEGRHPLPDLDELAAWFRAAGLDGDREVCVYDEREPAAAARAWWTLRYLGHPSVRLLDGGIAAWKAQGLAVTNQRAQPAPGNFRQQIRPALRLDDDLVEARAREGRLLDARAAERYTGESEGVDPIGGHIPGAISAPVSESFAADGRLRPESDLREHFAQTVTDPQSPVAVYCGSGVTAAAQVLALDVAGIPAQLFVGSWSKWVAATNPPVATGPGRGSWPQ